MTEWLEIVEAHSPEDVAVACHVLKRRNVAFIPSAGQLYSECEKAAANRVATQRASAPRLPRPEYSDAHRKAMQAKFSALISELKAAR